VLLVEAFIPVSICDVHHAAYVIANRTDVCVKFDAPLSAPVIVFEKSNGI
jgi:hypothetical protein